jgi:hypothetical protein
MSYDAWKKEHLEKWKKLEQKRRWMAEAVLNQNLFKVHQLYELGNNINAVMAVASLEDESATALCIAANTNNLLMVEYLLSRGARLVGNYLWGYRRALFLRCF